MYCVPIHDPQLASARRALAPFRILPKLVSYLTHRRSLRQSIKQMKRDARARYLEREKKIHHLSPFTRSEKTLDRNDVRDVIVN